MKLNIKHLTPVILIATVGLAGCPEDGSSDGPDFEVQQFSTCDNLTRQDRDILRARGYTCEDLYGGTVTIPIE